jgi:hypothetical protein
MSRTQPNDPLLTVTQILLRIGIAVMALIILAGTIAVLALLLFPDQQVAPQLTDASKGTVWWVAAGAATLITILVLSIAFTLNLSRIVSTVGEGDPFRPENADRLDRMAWLALATEACGFVLMPVVRTIASHIGELRGDFEMSFGGFVVALVLFILARVFRLGTRMRDDLEGTV